MVLFCYSAKPNLVKVHVNALASLGKSRSKIYFIEGCHKNTEKVFGTVTGRLRTVWNITIDL